MATQTPTKSTAPLGSTARTNQLLAEASQQTGVKAPTFSEGPIAQQTKAIGGAVVGGRIVGAGGVDLGEANIRDRAGYRAGMLAGDNPSKLDAEKEQLYTNPDTGELSPNLQKFTGRTPAPTEQDINSFANRNNLTLQQNAQGQYSAVPDLSSTYHQTKDVMDKSGQQFSTTGQGSKAVSTAMGQVGGQTEAPSILTPYVDSGVFGSDVLKDILANYYDTFSPEAQKVSFIDQYKQMSKELGLQEINADMVNIRAIIDGTEDSIRAEVTAAGGSITERQLQAMTNASNKQNILNYNRLLDSKNSMTEQLSTMMNLSIKDREFAIAEYERKTDFVFKTAQILETAKTRSITQLQWAITNGAGSEILKNPYETQLTEKRLGLPAGGLAGIVAKQSEADTQVVKLDNGKTVLINSKTGAVVKDLGGQKPQPLPGQYTEDQQKAITKINENVSKNTTYAKTTAMRGYVDNVSASLSQGTGVGDLAAINQFQKVIDEGAVTRDQDVKLIQSSQSLANNLKTKVKKLERGEQLSPALRTQMRTAVESLYDSQVKALNKDPYIQAKIKEASIYGLSEADTILGELGSFSREEKPKFEVQTPKGLLDLSKWEK